MNRYKYIQQLLLGLFLTFLFACNSSSHSNQQVQTADTNRLTSISLDGNKYQIDTAMILTNQNLQPLINDLDKAVLKTHNNTKDLPDFIKTFLDSLTGSDFSIANPGEDWQVGCVVIEKLPARQLVYLGLGDDIAMLSYFTGGIGKSEHVLIIKFADKNILDFWCGNVLVDLDNKKDILEYLKTNSKKDWGLNTNIIYL
jgi:hypothetical protein